MNRHRIGISGVTLAVALSTLACTAVKQDETETTVTIPADVSPSSTSAPADPSSSTTVPTDLGALDLELVEVAEVSAPVAMAARAGDPAVFVAEQEGRVRRIEITTNRSGAQTFTLERTPTIDISDDVVAGDEQGLLGIAFSTDGNRLYLAYTGTDERQHLDEVHMSGDRADASSRRELLVIDDFAPNHNGGQLAFGPDGFLYWAMGDGGGAGDPQGTGQDPSDLLGNLLRIDPDVLLDDEGGGAPYAIPDGNPFVGGGGAPEVWTYGLRNPWRFSFDSDTGDLWIADVGQGDVEEIDYLPADSSGQGAGRGANLGWSEVEGDRSFDGGTAPEDAVAPLFTYDHGDGGCAVTGGYVYRGAKLTALTGAYVYSDYCLGDIRAIVVRDGELVDERSLDLSAENPSSFGVDADGELYVLSLAGAVSRIVAASP